MGTRQEARVTRGMGEKNLKRENRTGLSGGPRPYSIGKKMLRCEGMATASIVGEGWGGGEGRRREGKGGERGEQEFTSDPIVQGRLV